METAANFFRVGALRFRHWADDRVGLDVGKLGWGGKNAGPNPTSSAQNTGEYEDEYGHYRLNQEGMTLLELLEDELTNIELEKRRRTTLASRRSTNALNTPNSVSNAVTPQTTNLNFTPQLDPISGLPVPTPNSLNVPDNNRDTNDPLSLTRGSSAYTIVETQTHIDMFEILHLNKEGKLTTSHFFRLMSLFIQVSWPAVFSSAMVLAPGVINMHFTTHHHLDQNGKLKVEVQGPGHHESSYDYSKYVSASGLGLGNIILGTFGNTLVTGLNQGIDVYVSTSHQCEGREHFALVYLARAMLIGVLLWPILVLICAFLGPWALKFAFSFGDWSHFSGDDDDQYESVQKLHSLLGTVTHSLSAQNTTSSNNSSAGDPSLTLVSTPTNSESDSLSTKHFSNVLDQANDYLYGCCFGLLFSILQETSYRFILFRGKVKGLLPHQILCNLLLHPIWAWLLTTTHMFEINLGPSLTEKLHPYGGPWMVGTGGLGIFGLGLANSVTWGLQCIGYLYLIYVFEASFEFVLESGEGDEDGEYESEGYGSQPVTDSEQNPRHSQASRASARGSGRVSGGLHPSDSAGKLIQGSDFFGNSKPLGSRPLNNKKSTDSSSSSPNYRKLNQAMQSTGNKFVVPLSKSVKDIYGHVSPQRMTINVPKSLESEAGHELEEVEQHHHHKVSQDGVAKRRSDSAGADNATTKEVHIREAGLVSGTPSASSNEDEEEWHKGLEKLAPSSARDSRPSMLLKDAQEALKGFMPTTTANDKSGSESASQEPDPESSDELGLGRFFFGKTKSEKKGQTHGDHHHHHSSAGSQSEHDTKGNRRHSSSGIGSSDVSEMENPVNKTYSGSNTRKSVPGQSQVSMTKSKSEHSGTNLFARGRASLPAAMFSESTQLQLGLAQRVEKVGKKTSVSRDHDHDGSDSGSDDHHDHTHIREAPTVTATRHSTLSNLPAFNSPTNSPNKKKSFMRSATSHALGSHNSHSGENLSLKRGSIALHDHGAHASRATSRASKTPLPLQYAAIQQMRNQKAGKTSGSLLKKQSTVGNLGLASIASQAIDTVGLGVGLGSVSPGKGSPVKGSIGSSPKSAKPKIQRVGSQLLRPPSAKSDPDIPSPISSKNLPTGEDGDSNKKDNATEANTGKESVPITQSAFMRKKYKDTVNEAKSSKAEKKDQNEIPPPMGRKSKTEPHLFSEALGAVLKGDPPQPTGLDNPLLIKSGDLTVIENPLKRGSGSFIIKKNLSSPSVGGSSALSSSLQLMAAASDGFAAAAANIEAVAASQSQMLQSHSSAAGKVPESYPDFNLVASKSKSDSSQKQSQNQSIQNQSQSDALLASSALASASLQKKSKVLAMGVKKMTMLSDILESVDNNALASLISTGQANLMSTSMRESSQNNRNLNSASRVKRANSGGATANSGQTQSQGGSQPLSTGDSFEVPTSTSLPGAISETGSGGLKSLLGGVAETVFGSRVQKNTVNTETPPRDKARPPNRFNKKAHSTSGAAAEKLRANTDPELTLSLLENEASSSANKGIKPKTPESPKSKGPSPSNIVSLTLTPKQTSASHALARTTSPQYPDSQNLAKSSKQVGTGVSPKLSPLQTTITNNFNKPSSMKRGTTESDVQKSNTEKTNTEKTAKIHPDDIPVQNPFFQGWSFPDYLPTIPALGAENDDELENFQWRRLVLAKGTMNIDSEKGKMSTTTAMSKINEVRPTSGESQLGSRMENSENNRKSKVSKKKSSRKSKSEREESASERKSRMLLEDIQKDDTGSVAGSRTSISSRKSRGGTHSGSLQSLEIDDHIRRNSASMSGMAFEIHAYMVFLVLDWGNPDIYSTKSLYRYLRLAIPACLGKVLTSMRNDCLIILAAFFAKQHIDSAEKTAMIFEREVRKAERDGGFGFDRYYHKHVHRDGFDEHADYGVKHDHNFDQIHSPNFNPLDYNTLLTLSSHLKNQSHHETTHILFLQCVLVNLYTIVSLVPSGVSSSATMLVGQALGRSQPELANSFSSLAVIGTLFIVIGTILCYCFIVATINTFEGIFITGRITSFYDLLYTLCLAQTYYQPISVWYHVDTKLGLAYSRDKHVPTLDIVLPIMMLLVLIPEGVAITSTGILRACGRWRAGATGTFISHYFIGVPLAIIFGLFTSYYWSSDLATTTKTVAKVVTGQVKLKKVLSSSTSGIAAADTHNVNHTVKATNSVLRSHNGSPDAATQTALDHLNPHTSNYVAYQLASLWLGVACGTLILCKWFCQLILKIDFGERADRTIQRLKKDENAPYVDPNFGNDIGQVFTHKIEDGYHKIEDGLYHVEHRIEDGLHQVEHKIEDGFHKIEHEVLVRMSSIAVGTGGVGPGQGKQLQGKTQNASGSGAEANQNWGQRIPDVIGEESDEERETKVEVAGDGARRESRGTQFESAVSVA